jgi:hypothetical protein
MSSSEHIETKEDKSVSPAKQGKVRQHLQPGRKPDTRQLFHVQARAKMD